MSAINNSHVERIFLLPRVIRAGDAHKYLGMDRNRFNREVKPHLITIRIGVQGIAYDRLDLDVWWEEYKSCNGTLGALIEKGEEQWEKKQQDSVAGQINRAGRGTSTKCITVGQFAKVVAQVTSKKRKDT